MGGSEGDHFRLWLRAGMTGCEFAKRLPGKAGRVAIEVHLDADMPPTDWMNNAFDEHAKAARAVIAVFPGIDSEASCIDFLNALATDERWTLRKRKKSSPTGGTLVGLEWTTSNGDVSETMGFAPFATMPVPRRAPYVAIATWPAGRSNPFRGTEPTPAAVEGRVSFIDSAHDFLEEDYRRLWSETEANVQAIMPLPPDCPGLYRRTAFVLAADAAAKLRFTT